MADIAKLKKKAADFEAAKKFDKAIAAYREVLDAYEAGGEGEVEVALYNRVGDMLIRQGDTGEAVTLYERAVDLYAEGGFFNNAIALCNKILRASPGRASVYYKLGKISAAKGFNGDAKKNFLEYADRMQKAGNKDESFRALKEFADLCPDEDDIRLMLADQLLKADRKGEAVDQLSILLELYQQRGQTAEADATQERIRAIDPSAKARTPTRKSSGAKAAPSDDLIFIDLDAPTPVRKSRLSTVIPVATPTEAPKVEPPPPPAEPEPAPAPELVVEPEPAPTVETPSLEGIETTALDSSAPPRQSVALLGLETTSLVPEAADEAAPMTAGEFAALDLSEVEEVKTTRESARDLALPGELPLIDTSMAVGEAAPAEPSAPPAEIPLLDLTEPLAPPREEPAVDVELPMLEVSAPAPEAAAPATAEDLGMIDLEAATPEAAAAPEVEAPTEFGEVDVEIVEAPTPPVRRTTTMAIPMAAASVEDLREQVAKEPENWKLRRQLADAMIDEGGRDEGLAMLEETMAGLERSGNLSEARSVADEIVRLNPSSVRHHQKRVEYAFRDDDKAGLASAYGDLADALFREGQADKAKAVYHRVLEITPNDPHALASLESLAALEPAAPEEKRPSAAAHPPASKRYTGMLTAIPDEAASAPAAKEAADDFVSLGDWLREDEEPKSTRMVVEEKEPTGDEDADFQDMLRKFKQGVAQNVEEEDHESHYDLGVAYKEMGLLDEAIAEFQKALRGTHLRVRTYEALGQCFLEKGQLPVALTILQRALVEPHVADDQLVGVLYLLGYVSEGLKKPVEAKAYYERVFAVDIQFRDIGARLEAVEAAIS